MPKVNKKSVYRWLTTELNKYGITLREFKKSPVQAFKTSKTIREWLMRVQNYNDDFKWYGQNFSWRNHMTESDWVKYDSELFAAGN